MLVSQGLNLFREKRIFCINNCKQQYLCQILSYFGTQNPNPSKVIFFYLYFCFFAFLKYNVKQNKQAMSKKILKTGFSNRIFSIVSSDIYTPQQFLFCIVHFPFLFRFCFLFSALCLCLFFFSSFISQKLSLNQFCFISEVCALDCHHHIQELMKDDLFQSLPEIFALSLVIQIVQTAHF